MKKKTVLDKALDDTKKNYRKRIGKINNYIPDVRLRGHIELRGEFSGWSFITSEIRNLSDFTSIARVYKDGDEKFSSAVSRCDAGKAVMELIRIYSMGYSDGYSDGELNESVRIFSTVNSDKAKRKKSFVDRDPHQYIKPPVLPTER